MGGAVPSSAAEDGVTAMKVLDKRNSAAPRSIGLRRQRSAAAVGLKRMAKGIFMIMILRAKVYRELTLGVAERDGLTLEPFSTGA
jgi:hypothetical protein